MLTEWHSTEVALENLLADALPVGLHVPCKLAALSARVRAKLTFVRLFARVTSSVNGQVAPVLENLSAKLARVVPPVGDDLPPVLRVEEGLDLTLLHDRLDCARLHRRQVRRQDQRLFDRFLSSEQLASWGPEWT